jgi:hypothetical protein
MLKLRLDLLEIARGQREQESVAGPFGYIVHTLKPRSANVSSNIPVILTTKEEYETWLTVQVEKALKLQRPR